MNPRRATLRIELYNYSRYVLFCGMNDRWWLGIILTRYPRRQKRCPNLRSLKLAWCREITDAAVAHLVKLQRLVELDLQLTSITASACKSLSQLTSLEKLDLSACNIGSVGIPCLLPERPRSNLKELELRFNTNLDETALKVLLTRTPRLEVLNVQCCELTRDSIKSIFVPLQRRGVNVRMDKIVDGYYVPRSLTGL